MAQAPSTFALITRLPKYMSRMIRIVFLICITFPSFAAESQLIQHLLFDWVISIPSFLLSAPVQLDENQISRPLRKTIWS